MEEGAITEKKTKKKQSYSETQGQGKSALYVPLAANSTNILLANFGGFEG